MNRNSLIKIASLILMLILLVLCSFTLVNDEFDISDINTFISTGEQGEFHIQGVAIDKENGFLYYSYTDKIVKSDFEGNIIGSISGFFGHIGCIDFNETDEKLYASLEYKHDVIGQNILANKTDVQFDDSFYIAIFDVGKIIEGNYDILRYPDMMKTVYLSEVLDDYKGNGLNKSGEKVAHKYGCSGIDGICIAPLPGAKNNDMFLYVAYGIYSDVSRNDNDNQIILCYNIDELSSFAEDFDQKSMHNNGPEKADYRFFVYTGNTNFGVQNMAYDKSSGLILMATYPGEKDYFENYSLYAVDINEKPIESKITGINETGLILPLISSGCFEDKEIYGWYSALGSCGMCSLDNGYYYLAENINNNGIYSANIKLHRFDVEKGFEPVT